MDETIYVITLHDGTEIKATVNGNNYITSQEITKEMLSDGNLVRFSINGDAYQRYTCTNLWTEEDGTHIIIREITADEWLLRQIDAKLQYVAMMTEVDL